MRSVISTMGMLRYRVRAPTFVSSSSLCWRKSRQMASTSPDSLPFPAPPICYQIAHHTAYFLPFLVGTHEFCATCVRFHEREKYWNDGQMHVFWGFWEQKQHIFRASAQVLHARKGGFTMSCFISVLSVDMLSCWLSAFERKEKTGKRSSSSCSN